MQRSPNLLAAALVLAAACAGPAPRPGDDRFLVSQRLEEQASGVTALLQAVSVVDTSVAWISGHQATVLRTTDGGRSWQRRPVSGAPDSLQFRDVHAFDHRNALLLAAGPGDMSRIYRTEDGGTTWRLQWTNPEPAGFYDCFDFWDRDRGLVYGDAVNGELRILVTDDGGRTWRFVRAEALPAALPGEGGFAASGLCVDAREGGRAWIAAGNAARARVLATYDYGRSWSATEVPVVAGSGAGLTAISMSTDLRGVAFGGDLAVTDRTTDNVTATSDGGRTWTLLPHVSFPGAIYGGLHLHGGDAHIAAVGPGGFAVSPADGRQWTTIDSRPWWGIGSAPGATWIAGPEGRIARVRTAPDEREATSGS